MGHAQSQSQSQQGNGSNSANDSPTNKVDNQLPCIAVHCVAGLGRAPVLVAIALIESGLKYEDAVEMIRGIQFLFQFNFSIFIYFFFSCASRRNKC